MHFLYNSKTRWTIFVPNSLHFHHFWTTSFYQSEDNKIVKNQIGFPYFNIIKKIIFQLSETDFWLRKWILKVEVFKLLSVPPRVCVSCQKKSKPSVNLLCLGRFISPTGKVKHFTHRHPIDQVLLKKSGLTR